MATAPIMVVAAAEVVKALGAPAPEAAAAAGTAGSSAAHVAATVPDSDEDMPGSEGKDEVLAILLANGVQEEVREQIGQCLARKKFRLAVAPYER